MAIRFTSLRAATSILALAGSLSAAAPALAQTAAAPQDSKDKKPGDEVVVTAQFRAQKLQDAPLAITAVTGSMLEARGETSIADIGNQALNVS